MTRYPAPRRTSNTTAIYLGVFSLGATLAVAAAVASFVVRTMHHLLAVLPG